MLSICRDFDVPFIVNDSPELALEVGADGVHVGQEDVSVAACRELLGADAIVGLSTHSRRRVRRGPPPARDLLQRRAASCPPRPSPGARAPASTYAVECQARSDRPVFVTGGVTRRQHRPAWSRRACATSSSCAPSPRRPTPRPRARELRRALDEALDLAVTVEPTEQGGDHARVGAQLMAGALDQAQLGAAVGRRHEVARVADAGTSRSSVPWPIKQAARRDLARSPRAGRWRARRGAAPRPRAGPSRRPPRRRPARSDGSSSAGPHQGSRWAGAAKVATPRTRSSPRGDRQGQGATEAESGERDAPVDLARRGRGSWSRSSRHWVAEKVPVLPPTPESVPVATTQPDSLARCSASSGSRPAAWRPMPIARGSPWTSTRTWLADGPGVRRRDAQVQQRRAALELLVGEHAR